MREVSNQTPQDFFTRLQRILGFAMRKQGCADFCAEIRLRSIAQAKGKLPALSRKAESTNPKQAKRSFFRKANAKGVKNA